MLSVPFFYVDLQRLEPFWVFLYLTFFLCNPWAFFKSCSGTVFKCYYPRESLNVSIYCKICIVTFIVKTPTVQEYIDHIPCYFSIWSRYKEVTNVNSWCDSLETFIHVHARTQTRVHSGFSEVLNKWNQVEIIRHYSLHSVLWRSFQVHTHASTSSFIACE